MNILVTGASGMVGRNLCESPHFQDCTLFTPSSKELNLLDPSSVDAYLKSRSFDYVIHCAGKVGGIQANMNDPLGFFLNNLEMGKNLLLACTRSNVQNVINLGSSCIYPRNIDASLKEEMLLTGELEPTNEGYALAKLAVLKLCQYLNQKTGRAKFKTIIPCNLYGPYDKFDELNAHLIPAIIRKTHRAQQQQSMSIEVWGSGNARREFMFVNDLISFIRLAVDRFDDLPQETNVGLGYDYSINDYYNTTIHVLGAHGIKLEHDLSKPEGMRRKLVDVTKALSLNWKATTSLEEGISATYQYFLKAYD